MFVGKITFFSQSWMSKGHALRPIPTAGGQKAFEAEEREADGLYSAAQRNADRELRKAVAASGNFHNDLAFSAPSALPAFAEIISNSDDSQSNASGPATTSEMLVLF
jgi:hypothetical protein